MLQCWEVLYQIRVLRAQDSYTPLALHGGKGHLPALEMSEVSLPDVSNRNRDCKACQQHNANFTHFRVVKTVFLENGVFAPYRKQVILTKNGKNDDLHSTHENKGSRFSEPGNRRK